MHSVISTGTYAYYLTKITLSKRTTKIFLCSEHFLNPKQSDEFKNYLSTTKGLAILWWSSQFRFLSFLFNSTGDYVLHEGKENSFPSYFSMNVRKQFLYTEELTRECRLYWEMGLPHKWANMENSKIKQVSQQQLMAQANPPKPESLPEAIRLEHYYGPLAFLAVSLAISSLCFMCIEHRRTMKKINKIVYF